MTRKNQNWFDDNTSRDANRLIKDMRREADRRSIDYTEDWNGSHSITRFSASDTTRAGMVVVPTSNRQVAKGTWGSIARSLKAIGLLIIFVVLALVIL